MLDENQKRAVEELIREVGDQCIFSYFRNLSKEDISFKESENDPVSIADREAEKLLRDGLTRILPDSRFVGEESYAEDAGILKLLDQQDQPVWVVDPIDGTANFVAGREGFGIIICLVMGGETLSSWLYEVCSKAMTVLHKGQEIVTNAGEISAAASARPYKGQIGLRLFQFSEVQAMTGQVSDLLIQQAADPSIINYQRMLTGALDFVVYKVTYPWDHLAGVALVIKNGGIASRWSGQDFLVSDVYEGLVVARNREVYDLVMSEVVKPLSGSEEIMGLKVLKGKA
ncbi:MAG: inositol monophosphatase family protein [Methyloligellaceae bacterium]